MDPADPAIYSHFLDRRQPQLQPKDRSRPCGVVAGLGVRLSIVQELAIWCNDRVAVARTRGNRPPRP